MKKKSSKNKKGKNEEIFNFDNEIVIGVTKLPDEKKERHKKHIKSNKKGKVRKKKIKKEKVKQENTGDRINFFVKAIISITIVLGIVLFLLASPLFEILEIKVEGNNVLTKDEVVGLSRNKCR